APAAHDVPFPGDEFTGFEIVDVRADLNDPADEFMADDHRHGNGAASPVVPVVDVGVRAADSGSKDADQDVVDSDGGLLNISQPQTRLGMGFRQRFQIEPPAPPVRIMCWTSISDIAIMPVSIINTSRRFDATDSASPQTLHTWILWICPMRE